MFKIRTLLMVLGLLSCPLPSNAIQLSVGIGLPNVDLAINMPAYPELALIPGYPVYYAPRLNANYFFYDGFYWVYQDDDWYASSWYDGPWSYVEPEAVPLYLLRVPVRYYRQPPSYFMGWYSNSAPRWGDYWGNDWEQHRPGWDRWNRRAVPPPAPLPLYQRQYSGERYPQPIQQQELQKRHYNYQPNERFEPNERITPSGDRRPREQPAPRDYIEQRDDPRRQDMQRQQNIERQQNINRQQNNAPFMQRIPGQQVSPAQERPHAPAERRDRPQENQRPPAMQPAPAPAAPATQPQQRNIFGVPRTPPANSQPVPPQIQQPAQSQPVAGQREQQQARPRQQEDRPQNRDARGEPNRGQEQDRGQDKNRERERN